MHISGRIILFVCSKRRRVEALNFAAAVILLYIPFTTYEKKQLYRISGSQFYEWLFGPEMFSGLSRNRPQAPGRSRWPVEANDKHSVLQSIVECAVFIYLFGRVAREKPFVKLRPAYSLKLFFS